MTSSMPVVDHDYDGLSPFDQGRTINNSMQKLFHTIILGSIGKATENWARLDGNELQL